MSARQSIIDRIDAECDSFVQVQGIGDMTAALEKKIPINTPAAFVYRIRHTGGANGYGANAVRQRLTIRYGVLIVTRHANDAAGEKTANANDALLEELEAALLGFVPTDGAHVYTPMTIAEGSLVSLAGYHFWQEIYSMQRQARKT
jgi:hypothetical protein